MNRQNFNLYDLGFCSYFENQIERNEENKNLTVGRIITENHNIFSVLFEQGQLSAKLNGKLNNQIRNLEIEKPVVGDWVLMRKQDNEFALITLILSRFSSLYRNTAGKKTEKQLLAANINYGAF